MRSNIFRLIVIKSKNARTAPIEEIKDSDEEEGEELDEEDDIEDDYLDLPFDCKTEIMRAKKTALQNKASRVQWSGEDVLVDYDPDEA